MHEIRVPDLGNFEDVPVVDILVKPGDRIAAESTVIVLESEKATLDVPAPASGVVKQLCVKLGDKVRGGSLVLLLEGTDAGATADTSSPTVPVVEIAPQPVITVVPAARQNAPLLPTSASTLPFIAASPQVRKFARTLGVDLTQVIAAGSNGRVVMADVERFVQTELTRRSNSNAAVHQPARATGVLQVEPPEPQSIDFSVFGPIERQPLSRLRRIAGTNLARSWMQIPHVTNFDAADVTDLESFRKQINQERGDSGAKLTLLAFLMKASAVTLLEFPRFNASLAGQDLILKRYCHVGFAADTPNGLLVPVVRDVDRKGVLQIAREVTELAASARAGKLRLDQMQGGCFTISSLGSVGGTGFTPIINAPEVAILGSARTDYQPKWDGKQFIPRLMLPLCLSWDHRVVDGAAAARFLNYLSALLHDFRRVSL
jgi:pyruvate dehydrogenase E2 component (dihydrolipoamide acetyltransferase)